MSTSLNKDFPLLVIYHGGNCRDGFCSAWLARLAFPNAEFLAANYGDPAPDVLGKQVLIVDFSYPLETMVMMQRDCIGSLVVLDHHKTAMHALSRFDIECMDLKYTIPYIKFDMNKSGAMLTWEYLFSQGHMPDSIFGTRFNLHIPPFPVAYVEDRDLWRFNLPDSKAINARIRLEPFEFEKWNELHISWMRYNTSEFNIESEGMLILRREAAIIESHIRHAQEIEFDGHRVMCVNCTGDLQSEICERLAVGKPFAMCYFDTENCKRVYSLRSAPDGIDVSQIAKAHGGGGHRHAAGFTIQMPPVDFSPSPFSKPFTDPQSSMAIAKQS